MRKLDLDFLVNMENESHTLDATDSTILAQNILSVLRANRGTGKLSDEQVRTGNNFIMFMYALQCSTENINVGITQEDINIMSQEHIYMIMGDRRN